MVEHGLPFVLRGHIFYIPIFLPWANGSGCHMRGMANPECAGLASSLANRNSDMPIAIFESSPRLP